MKDSDGLTRGNLPAGCGLVDYTRVFEVQRDVGYQGRASVEVEFTDNPSRYMKQALDHVRLLRSGQILTNMHPSSRQSALPGRLFCGMFPGAVA